MRGKWYGFQTGGVWGGGGVTDKKGVQCRLHMAREKREGLIKLHGVTAELNECRILMRPWWWSEEKRKVICMQAE